MRRGISLLCIALVLSCAMSQAPSGFLPTAEDAQRDANGGWIVVHIKNGWSYAGELIAISKDEVDVLEQAAPTSRLVRLPMSSIEKMHFESYRTQAGKLSLWTALGALSTFGNGKFLVFTAPLFIIFGTMTAAVESRAAFLEYPGAEFADAWKFARFPQGLPPGVDECSLLYGRPCEVPDAAELPDAAPPPDAPPPPDAGPPPPDALARPRRFEFISEGPYHQSGQGEWIISVDGNDLRIVHNFHVFESREVGPQTLSNDELRELWIRLAEAQLDNLPTPPRNASDESLDTFILDGRKVRALAQDAKHDPKVRTLLAALERLIERYANEPARLR